MISRGVVFFVSLTVAVRGTPVADSGLGGCSGTNPVACVRDEMYRSLNALFSRDSADVSEEMDEGAESAQRRVRAIDADGAEPSGDLEARTSSRSLKSDTDLKDSNNTNDAVFEGRGKKLKRLLPLLLVLKVQYFVYGVIAYLVVALIAKAALIKGSLALALAGLFLLRKLLTHNAPLLTRHEVQVHQGGGHGAGWDSYKMAHTDQHKQHAHTAAFHGQKPLAGR